MARPLVPSTASVDAWIQVDKSENSRFFVNLLDATRARLLEQDRKSPMQFFGPLCPRSGLNILDVGCGTGDFLRLSAPLVSPGKAVGLDLSATMISGATQRTAKDAGIVSFRVGSALELPFEAETFDRVLATQVLLHIPDPWKALSEMKRVLVAPGLICITEIDWGTLVVQSSDNELGRRFSELASKGVAKRAHRTESFRSSVASLDSKTSLFDPRLKPLKSLTHSIRGSVEPSLKHFRRIGAYSEAEADTFLADLKERASRGSHFSSRTYRGVSDRVDRSHVAAQHPGPRLAGGSSLSSADERLP